MEIMGCVRKSQESQKKYRPVNTWNPRRNAPIGLPLTPAPYHCPLLFSSLKSKENYQNYSKLRNVRIFVIKLAKYTKFHELNLNLTINIYVFHLPRAYRNKLWLINKNQQKFIKNFPKIVIKIKLICLSVFLLQSITILIYTLFKEIYWTKIAIEGTNKLLVSYAKNILEENHSSARNVEQDL